MSAERAAISMPQVRGAVAGRERHILLRVNERVRPAQGWSSLLILLAALMMISMSVDDGSWVPTPGLAGLLFWSAIAGLALARVPVPAVLLHPLGIALGAALVAWQTLSQTDAVTLEAALPEIWSRLSVWYDAAANDGISTDLLPFTIAILSVAWMVGYVSSFFLFRNTNAWVAVVVGGTAILTNLSFLPATLGFSSKFFIFALLAMLLIVRASDVQNQAEWRRRGVRFEMMSSWLTMHSVIWFGIAVMVIAAMLPLRVYVSNELANWWNTARTPIANLEEDIERLLAGIPSRKDVPGRFFGKTLPFIGEISFGGEAVFWANTEYPSYWLSNTYSEYTSQGWKAGETSEIEVGPSTAPPPRPEWRKTLQIDQTVQLNFASDSFLAGGNLDWLSHDAVVETLRPKEFVIQMHNPEADKTLPPDIREIAEALREAGDPPQRFAESYISRVLPNDIVLNSIRFAIDDQATGVPVLDTVSLERKDVAAPEIVSWQFADRQPENHPYAMVSYVSVATDDELREADVDYSTFITDHYLQLPLSLPQRVRDKAAELTQNANNPYDKASAIAEYLRGEEFTYSQKIDAPPRDADGVDYFLFETKTGYSDYFASSMVVLLRAVDVPARLAAGYAPGEYDAENDVRVVRDNDSHGWVQVFFPEYGWIDFEPTPAWPEHQRELTSASIAGSLPSGGAAGMSGDTSEFLDPFNEIGLPGIGGLVDERQGTGFVSVDTLTTIATRGGIAIAVAAVAWGLLYWIWNAGLRGLSPVERAYAKMNRMGAIAGMRRRDGQTPSEYAAMLAGALDEAGGSARRIGAEFAALRYTRAGADYALHSRSNDAMLEHTGADAGSAADAGDGGALDAQSRMADEMEQAWRAIRGGLAALAFRRLLPGGNQR